MPSSCTCSRVFSFTTAPLLTLCSPPTSSGTRLTHPELTQISEVDIRRRDRRRARRDQDQATGRTPTVGPVDDRVRAAQASQVWARAPSRRQPTRRPWRPSTGTTSARPTLKRVKLVEYDSQRAAWSAMMRGEIDMLHEVSREAAEFVEAESSVKATKFLRPLLQRHRVQHCVIPMLVEAGGPSRAERGDRS